MLVTRRSVLGTFIANIATVPFALSQTTETSDQNTGGIVGKVRIEFNQQTLIATLYDNPSSRDFMSLLPLDLSIDDYSNNEKIAYLPRKLSEEGSGPFGDERPGDLCYYAPWGNLAFFHGSYRFSNGLIRLGRIEGNYELLLTRGKFDLRVDLQS
jgi:hypothetical protein